MKILRIFIALFLCVVALPAPAAAQPAGAQAEMLFRRGKELMTQGNFAEACSAFDASQKLDPTISTLMNRAYCREKNLQLATAWGLFLEAQRQTRAANDSTSKQLHRVSSEHAANLERRLSTLTINVAAENRILGLEVLRDSELVEVASWNQALPIDGGTYTITARAPGNAPWSTSLQIGAERDVKVIDIPKLKPVAIAQAPEALAPATANTTPPRGRSQIVSADQTPRDNPGRGLKLAGIVTGGAGVGLVVTGIVFGLMARSDRDDLQNAIDMGTKWSQELADKQTSGESKTTIANVTVGVGIAAIVGGGVLYYLGTRQVTSVEVKPAVSSRSFGASVVLRY